MALILIIMLLCATASLLAILHCPLARAIGLGMRCFAEASQGERDVLR